MKRRVLALWLVLIICISSIFVSYGEETTTVNLYFVRHGKTILNTLTRVQGWSDSPLTEAGIEVAKDAACGMSDIKFDYAYSSDRMRCIETANIIMNDNKVSEKKEIVTMAGLRETNFGKYEGGEDAVMWGEVLKQHGVATRDEFFAKYENGSELAVNTIAANDETGVAENHQEVVTRLMEAVNTIVSETTQKGGGNVLVVGHGAAIGTILEAIGTSVPGGGVANASVTLVQYRNGIYDVKSIGDMSYAERGAQARSNADIGNEVVIYLTRHGKTVFNTMDRVQGWIDSPLTPAGVEVAENLGKGLSDVKFSAVYTSDMGRTIETAQLVLDHSKVSDALTINQRKGLRETYYGKYEGGFNSVMLEAAMEHYGVSGREELLQMEDSIKKVIDVLHDTDETGMAENYTQMSERVVGTFKEVAAEAAQNGGGNVLVVSHGNAIMAIVNSISNSNVSDISNAAVTKIIYKDGQFTVESVNDKSYIEKGAAMN